eukprot:2793851-Prymnesium_polylepis.1
MCECDRSDREQRDAACARCDADGQRPDMWACMRTGHSHRRETRGPVGQLQFARQNSSLVSFVTTTQVLYGGRMHVSPTTKA